MTFIPRQDRSELRGDRAAIASRAMGGDIMDATLARIGAEFNGADRINNFKLRCERAIQGTISDQALQARYGARLARLRHLTVAQAYDLVALWFKAEQDALRIPIALGTPRATFLSLEILRELRLMLRLARYLVDSHLTIGCVVNNLHGE